MQQAPRTGDVRTVCISTSKAFVSLRAHCFHVLRHTHTHWYIIFIDPDTITPTATFTRASGSKDGAMVRVSIHGNQANTTLGSGTTTSSMALEFSRASTRRAMRGTGSTIFAMGMVFCWYVSLLFLYPYPLPRSQYSLPL